MCGRFTIISNPIAYQLEFDIQVDPGKRIHWDTRYNISPGQSVPVIKDAQQRTLDMMQWGLIPNWATGTKKIIRLINIRSETIAEKAFTRQLLQQGKRCLILADGFYEWQVADRKNSLKAPFYFHLKGHKPFAFAGIWNACRTSESHLIETCAILTCVPNDLVSRVHDRMPVILNRETGMQWLSPNPFAELIALLTPYPANEMVSYPVNPRVNNPALDSEECLLPAEGDR